QLVKTIVGTWNGVVKFFNENATIKEIKAWILDPIGKFIELVKNTITTVTTTTTEIKLPTAQEIIDTLGFNTFVTNIANAWAAIQKTVTENAAIKGIMGFFKDPWKALTELGKQLGIVQEVEGTPGSTPGL